MRSFWRQHGYAKGNPCLTNLITIYEEITKSVGEGREVDFTYLDFGKAFDAVSHSILVFKFGCYGVVGWKLGFQSVVNGSSPVWRPVTSTFSQGPLLGSVLFYLLVSGRRRRGALW